MFPRFLLMLWLAVSLGCSPSTPDTGPQEVLESPAGEAALRHVLTLCPHRSAAKQLTIVTGPAMTSASTAFENRFSDTGFTITPARQLVAGAVNGQVRVFDGNTNQLPIILQISSLTPDALSPPDLQAVAAWSYKEDAKRYQLAVRPRPDGSFEVKEIAEIPIPLRNQDGMPAPATPAVPAPSAGVPQGTPSPTTPPE